MAVPDGVNAAIVNPACFNSRRAAGHGSSVANGRLQRRSHRGSNRLAIERVAARRIKGDAVRGKCGGAAEDAADVVRVADSLEDDQRSRRGDRGNAGARRTFCEGEAAAMEVEAGHLRDDGRGGDEGLNSIRQMRLKRLVRRRRDQHARQHDTGVAAAGARRRAALRPRAGRAPAARPDRRRGDRRRAAGRPGGRRARSRAQSSSSSRRTERRKRWVSRTCWPSRLLMKTLDSLLSTGCGTNRMTLNASCASALRIS